LPRRTCSRTLLDSRSKTNCAVIFRTKFVVGRSLRFAGRVQRTFPKRIFRSLSENRRYAAGSLEGRGNYAVAALGINRRADDFCRNRPSNFRCIRRQFYKPPLRGRLSLRGNVFDRFTCSRSRIRPSETWGGGRSRRPEKYKSNTFPARCLARARCYYVVVVPADFDGRGRRKRRIIDVVYKYVTSAVRTDRQVAERKKPLDYGVVPERTV